MRKIAVKKSKKYNNKITAKRRVEKLEVITTQLAAIKRTNKEKIKKNAKHEADKADDQ